MPKEQTKPEPNLHEELAALRSEIAALRAQVTSLQEVQLVANREELGVRSVIGLRRFGTLMYVLMLPLIFVARPIRRFVRWCYRTYWIAIYASSFTTVYLKGANRDQPGRSRSYLSTFSEIFSRLNKNPQ